MRPSVTGASLAKSIARFPWPHRATLVLCDGARLAPEEAAAALGVPVADLRRSLSDVRQAVTTLLGPA